MLLLEVEACCTSLDNEKIVIKYNIHALPPRGRVLELFSPLVGVGDTSFVVCVKTGSRPDMPAV